jgi:hypothetical protein
MRTLIPFGDGQLGTATIDFNSNGLAFTALSGGGKSTFLTTLASNAKIIIPDLRITIISLGGSFDYDLKFPFEFISALYDEDKVVQWLESDYERMVILMKAMEVQRVKRAALLKAVPFFNHMLMVDELENIESQLDKGRLAQLSKRLNTRFNIGRKLGSFSVVASQSQDLSAYTTRIKLLERRLLGRPATTSLCISLNLDPKWASDYSLREGRLIYLSGESTQVVKVWQT